MNRCCNREATRLFACSSAIGVDCVPHGRARCQVILEVDTGSAVPPYEQIRVQIEQLAASGQLAEGSRLPTIRQLAGDLGLAPGTVARAYRELEAAGVVRSRVRHGTTIAARPKPSAKETTDRLAAAARAYALAVAALEVPRDAAVGEFDRQLGELL